MSDDLKAAAEEVAREIYALDPIGSTTGFELRVSALIERALRKQQEAQEAVRDHLQEKMRGYQDLQLKAESARDAAVAALRKISAYGSDDAGALRYDKNVHPLILIAEAALTPDAGDMVLVPVKSLLAVRDALASNDIDEAYHQLYWSVTWQDPYKPWTEWESLAAAREAN